MGDDADITELLNQAALGDSEAADRLYTALEPELRTIARKWMRSQSPGHMLQTTALINEAYLRLAHNAGGDWAARQQFFAVASKTMRSVLVDNARKDSAAKRGGGAKRNALPMDLAASGSMDVVELNDLLATLGASDPESERIAELRIFGGLDHQTIADILGTSKRNVERKWAFVKAYVQRQQD